MSTLDGGNTVLDKTDKKDLYQRNLNALRKHHPELADMIESLIIAEDRIRVLDSESGQPRISYKKDDGEEVFIHNAEDPAKCANQAMELLGHMESEGVAILMGFGLGYLADKVLEVSGDGHILMVYEATPELFKTALQTRDLCKVLESEKVRIVLGPDGDNFSDIQSHHQLIVNGKFWVVKHHPSIKLNEKAYDNFYKRLNEEKRLVDAGVATAVGLGKEFINAFLANVPYILRRPGVSKLKDVFKDSPAIIVSAGPSLDKNLHMLKKARGRAVIIAVDAVLPTLLPCGIIPDIVVAIDPVVYNTIMFENMPVLKEVPFICLAQYTPEIVNMYPGPVFFNSVTVNIAYQWLSSFWEDKGFIDCFGGSVAHFAFSAAEFLGSNSIAFIGQDLSFVSKKTHTSAFSDLVDEQYKEEVRKGNKGVRPQLLGAIPAKDIFGDDVLTREDFLAFKTSFESKIKSFRGVVVNATEGGLPIEGTVLMRFTDFIDTYCNNAPEIESLSIMSKLQDNEPDFNLEGLLNEVRVARDKFREIRKYSVRTLKNIKKLKSLKQRGEKDTRMFSNLLDKVESTIEHVKHPLLNLMVGYHYGLELFMKRQDIQEVDDIEDKWEKLDKQLDRGLLYYGELNNAIYPFKNKLDLLITALEIEERASSVLSDESLGQERFYRAGMIYKKAGMAVHAVRCLEKVDRSQKSEVKSQKELVLLAEMYVKQFRFYEARDILKNIEVPVAGVLSKMEESAENLLKECNEKIGEWEKRKRKMFKLVEDAEANYGGSLESGYFYFRVSDYARAKGAYQIAVEESVDDKESLIKAYYGLAHTNIAMDDMESGFDILEKSIKVDPANPVLYRDMGLIALQNNNVEASELFFLKAIELAPFEAELYRKLSEIYMRMGKKEKAIALYENALQSNVDNPIIQQDLAMIYKEAIADVEAG